MSGNPTSNVVPMPHVQAPASNPAQAPMPFPMWSGGGSLPWGPGCCPPGGMDALMKCYCDVQAATAFICQVMVQCVQTNPAVTAAIIAAIEASGSSLPLIGVTNGAAAQPGQVGEYVLQVYQGNFTTGTQNQVFTTGIIQPGDWLVQTYCEPVPPITYMLSQLTSQVGFSTGLIGYTSESSGGVGQMIVSQPAQLLASVPTLMAFAMETVAAAAGAFTFGVEAWRMR